VALSVAGPGRVAVTGALTIDTVPALAREAGHVLGAQHDGRVEVELGGVTQADSAGLALLVGWVAAARDVRLTLAFHGVPERLRAIARISEVEALLTGAPA
jgi:phospholipid transport system transporter-binding protein